MNRARGVERLALIAAAAGALALLLFARSLTPLPGNAGVAGMPPLPPCGFRLMTGYPCITCGMTRAFALMAHGRVAEGFGVQPFGAVLFLGTLLVPAAAAALLARNRPLLPLLRTVPWRRTLAFAALLALLAWGYAIAVARSERGAGGAGPPPGARRP